MQYSRFALAATPALFAFASAYGNAIVKNSCADDAYLWSCGDTAGQRKTVTAGSSYTEQYYTKSGGGGISLKIATKYPNGPKAGQIPDIMNDQPAPYITQFEYTVGTAGPPAASVWYDISNINGYPFVQGGLSVISNDHKVNVSCPANVEKCKAAYNSPFEDTATGSAADSVDLTMELCSDRKGVSVSGGTSSGGSNGGSPAPQPSPSSTPAAVAPSSSHPVPVSPQPTPPQSSPQPSHPATQSTPPTNEKVAVGNAGSSPPAQGNNDVVVVVTQTETAAPVVVTKVAKRHEHDHMHAHKRNNKQRHDNQ